MDVGVELVSKATSIEKKPESFQNDYNQLRRSLSKRRKVIFLYAAIIARLSHQLLICTAAPYVCMLQKLSGY
jgi:hypothetical protein